MANCIHMYRLLQYKTCSYLLEEYLAIYLIEGPWQPINVAGSLLKAVSELNLVHTHTYVCREMYSVCIIYNSFNVILEPYNLHV